VAWVRSSNWVHYLLAHSMQGPPGEQMNYNTGNTHLLSAILTEVSGGNTWTFGEKALAAPSGITLLNAAAILLARPPTLLKPSTTCAPQRRRSPVKGGFTHVDVGKTW